VDVATIAPLRRPPHDPLTLLLGGRLGWPGLEATRESLVLPPAPGSLPLLTDPSGSFGGLRPPSNVAVSDTGEIWLLQRGTARLLRFDPCGCGFLEMPCLGGEGERPGRMLSPTGLATAAGRLFVCDTGNRRVQVLVARTLSVAAILRPPMDWEPTGVVVDELFRVHVVDPRNGMVHHFGWSGRYRGNTPGVGASRHVMVGPERSLLVAGDVEAFRIDDEGVVAPLDPADADSLRSQLRAAPFEVGPTGDLHLGPLCEPPSDVWFSPGGETLATPTVRVARFERAHDFVVGPLDSLIDDCEWHRLVLVGDIPTGCGVRVDSFTAQVPLSAAEIQTLPESSWETRIACTGLDDTGAGAGEWDVLLRSPRGRQLWLRLGLFGTGFRTPRLEEVEVEFPRISLRRHLPAVYGAEPTSADFTDRLLALYDRVLRDLESGIDDLPALFDPRSTPALDWLAAWVGLTVDPRLADRIRRRLVADSANLLDLRGTLAGLQRLLVLVLGLADVAANAPGSCGAACAGACGASHGSPCRGCGHSGHERSCGLCPPPRTACPPEEPVRRSWTPPPFVLEHFRLRRWLEAGSSRIGDSAILWGESIVRRSRLDDTAQVGATALKTAQDPLRDPFHVYAHRFSVFVPAASARGESMRRALEGLVTQWSPAHTQGCVEYVEPRMRIGVQASIGLDAVVARLPHGVTLGATPLGIASVLDGGDGPSVDRSAIGSTTVIS
jgi:phage tail-like protein